MRDTVTVPPSMVYVVDDDDAVRASLKLLLRSAGWRTECFASAQAFLEEYTPDSSGCLVLDLRLPGINGLELQQELRRRGVELPILLISGHGDVAIAVEAMKFGAFDFIQKPFLDQTLLDSVRRAINVDANRRRALCTHGDLRRRFQTLTARENQVLALIVDGCTNKFIAATLDMSERTVEVHRARLMEKLEARSLAQLVRMALQLGVAAFDSRGSEIPDGAWEG